MPIKTFKNEAPEMYKDVHNVDLEIVELIKKYDSENTAVIFIRNQFQNKNDDGVETNILFGNITGNYDLAKNGLKAMLIQKQSFYHLVINSIIELYEEDFEPVKLFFDAIAKNIKI